MNTFQLAEEKEVEAEPSQACERGQGRKVLHLSAFEVEPLQACERGQGRKVRNVASREIDLGNRLNIVGRDIFDALLELARCRFSDD